MLDIFYPVSRFPGPLLLNPCCSHLLGTDESNSPLPQLLLLFPAHGAAWLAFPGYSGSGRASTCANQEVPGNEHSLEQPVSMGDGKNFPFLELMQI